MIMHHVARTSSSQSLKVNSSVFHHMLQKQNTTLKWKIDALQPLLRQPFFSVIFFHLREIEINPSFHALVEYH